MGNCFSDPSKPPGKGQTLGSTPSRPAQSSSTTTTTTTTQPSPAGGRPAKQKINSPPPQTLGAPGGGGDAGDPRERALKAAEERAKTARKGVNVSNPKAGQLSGKLAAERKAGNGPEAGNERLMVDASSQEGTRMRLVIARQKRAPERSSFEGRRFLEAEDY
ncbi:hypothetical protein I352_04196 [Cryptococcus deuterogattii MMRL2647]|nr:hypothetical protein I352_04196 [Cryptococcus deuterogattii MMRL2647]